MAYDASRGVTVLQGGILRSSTGWTMFGAPTTETWEWDGSNWTQRNVPGAPAISGHLMAYDSVNQLVLAYVPLTQALWTYDGVEWRQVPRQATWPALASVAVMAFDEHRGVLVLAYPNQPTWEWNGESWTQGAIAPSNAGLVGSYDPARQRVVSIRQGATTSFTEWDGTTWTSSLLTPTPAGSIQALSPTPALDGLIAFGLPPIFYSTEYAYSIRGSATSPLPRQTAPPPIESPYGTFDPARQVGVLVLANGASVGTWELRGETWFPRSTGATDVRPPAGGFDQGTIGYSHERGTCVLAWGQLWEWNGLVWRRIGTGTTPSFRGSTSTNEFGMLFLGGSVQRLAGDQLVSVGSAGSIGNAAMAFDPVRAKAVVAGASQNFLTQTFDPMTAQLATVNSVSQTSRYDPEMVYAPTLGGTVLFGGFYGPGNAEGNLFNVIYLLRPTSNSWEATSYRGPFGRKFQAMFYDSASERIVMFGGLVSYGSPANGLHAGDTWFLSSGPASLVRQPEATRVNPGAQAELFVIAKGGGPIKYQWRHNGEPVQDNERIRGSQSDTMVITATTSQDAGDYTCTVENACGLELSVAAQVEVRCVADLDDGSAAGSPDGGVDISDLLYFLVQFERGQDDADVDDGSGTGTADNAVTIDDLLFFLLRFEAGC